MILRKTKNMTKTEARKRRDEEKQEGGNKKREIQIKLICKLRKNFIKICFRSQLKAFKYILQMKDTLCFQDQTSRSDAVI